MWRAVGNPLEYVTLPALQVHTRNRGHQLERTCQLSDNHQFVWSHLPLWTNYTRKYKKCKVNVVKHLITESLLPTDTGLNLKVAILNGNIAVTLVCKKGSQVPCFKSANEPLNR